MICRQIERTPRRTLMSVLGVSLGVSVMILGSFSEDSVRYLINLLFHETQRYDVSITFTEPTTSGVEYDLRHLPGVMRSERFRAVPARLRMGHRSRLVAIQGIPKSNDLYRLIDLEGKTFDVPAHGLLVSAELARLLGAAAGDELTVEVLEGQRQRTRLPIAGTIEDASGLSAYTDFDALGAILREAGTASGAYLQVDRMHQGELLRQLKQTPRIAAVNVKQVAIDSFEETIAKNLLTMRLFNVIFAAVIAVGVVYNTARVALAERSRDLATLRVLGFTRGEISAILLGELAVITLMGLPLGCLLGYLFSYGAITSVDRELFRIPLVIRPRTYLMAMSVIVLAALLASLLVRRRLDRLDLVEVLKTRE